MRCLMCWKRGYSLAHVRGAWKSFGSVAVASLRNAAASFSSDAWLMGRSPTPLLLLLLLLLLLSKAAAAAGAFV